LEEDFPKIPKANGSGRLKPLTKMLKEIDFLPSADCEFLWTTG
jgi:hypothetical protein